MGSKTTNYQLNQWEADDSFLRTDFNEDNAKIDAALTAMPKLAWGQYQGLQASGNATVQDVTLGYRPRVVQVIPANGRLSDSGGYYGGLFFDGQTNCPGAITFTATGFRVWNQSSQFSYLNLSGEGYIYLVVQ